ncbi:MAG: type II secretion system F family protein [Flaviflexus sp.]|nr:type II secretion system F family protein [Flaviflexus sp.]
MSAVIAGLIALALLAGSLPARRLPRPPRPRTARPRPLDEAMIIDLVGALISAGAAIPVALESLGQCLPPGAEATEAATAGKALLLGASWEEAWGEEPRLARLAAALEPAWQDGAPPVILLQRAAGAVRARRMKDAQEAAGRLSVRLVLPLGLCFLPAFFLIGVVPIVLSLGMKLLGAP